MTTATTAMTARLKDCLRDFPTTVKELCRAGHPDEANRFLLAQVELVRAIHILDTPGLSDAHVEAVATEKASEIVDDLGDLLDTGDYRKLNHDGARVRRFEQDVTKLTRDLLTERGVSVGVTQ